jgi:hypothetical protein
MRCARCVWELRVSGDSSICRSIFACRCLFGFVALGLDVDVDVDVDFAACLLVVKTHPTRPPPAPISRLSRVNNWLVLSF